MASNSLSELAVCSLCCLEHVLTSRCSQVYTYPTPSVENPRPGCYWVFVSCLLARLLSRTRRCMRTCSSINVYVTYTQMHKSAYSLHTCKDMHMYTAYTFRELTFHLQSQHPPEGFFLAFLISYMRVLPYLWGTLAFRNSSSNS